MMMKNGGVCVCLSGSFAFSQPALFTLCAGNELFYCLLYLFNFSEGPLGRKIEGRWEGGSRVLACPGDGGCRFLPGSLHQIHPLLPPCSGLHGALPPGALGHGPHRPAQVPYQRGPPGHSRPQHGSPGLSRPGQEEVTAKSRCATRLPAPRGSQVHVFLVESSLWEGGQPLG